MSQLRTEKSKRKHVDRWTKNDLMETALERAMVGRFWSKHAMRIIKDDATSNSLLL
jgi:hypothetical protein